MTRATGARRVLVLILIEDRQITEIEEIEFEFRRRELDERLGEFPVDGVLADASYNDGDFERHVKVSGLRLDHFLTYR